MRSFFMGVFWTDLDSHIRKAAWGCLGFTLIWVLISMGLYACEEPKSYFDIQSILGFKIIFVAVIFLGRYLLFPQYRRQTCFGRFLFLGILIALCAQSSDIVKAGTNGLYILLKVVDAFVWGLFVALFFENMEGLFSFWRHSQKKNVSLFNPLLETLRQDTISLGIMLTLLAGLLYYYLTSFYLLDTLFYNYLILALVLVTGLGFYFLVQIKLNRWVKQDIGLIDQEIDNYLEWQQFKQDSGLNQKIVWLEYLTIIRNYLTQKGRPKFPWQIWGSYLLFSCFILVLPYIFGLAIQVGSFK
jgi:hypothetical protein